MGRAGTFTCCSLAFCNHEAPCSCGVKYVMRLLPSWTNKEETEREMKDTAKVTELEKWVGMLTLILTSPLWNRAQGTGKSEVQLSLSSVAASLESHWPVFSDVDGSVTEWGLLGSWHTELGVLLLFGNSASPGSWKIHRWCLLHMTASKLQRKMLCSNTGQTWRPKAGPLWWLIRKVPHLLFAPSFITTSTAFSLPPQSENFCTG